MYLPRISFSVSKTLFATLILVWATTSTYAQSLTTSRTDGHTPSALTAGTPTGSYPLSDFESVNPYNGGLNFHFPLVRIGGRGSAGYTMMLPIERKWNVEHTFWPPPNPQCQMCPWQNDQTVPIDFYMPVFSSGVEGIEMYGPGRLELRVSGEGYTDCPPSADPYYQTTLTRLTFTSADGTQIEFRDAATGGQPRANPMGSQCTTGQGFNRGRLFFSGDGSAATFISDTDIKDFTLAADYSGTPATGNLLLADGSTYRVENGEIVWMRDRNGNKVTPTTDSLGRQVTVTPANYPTTQFDQISYKGFGGASRSIKVWYGNLSQILRVTQPTDSATIKTYPQLFPGLSLPSLSNYDFDLVLVRRLELPDGRNYQFFYNVYGELARIELPTGGAIEYDHDSGLTAGTSGLVNGANPGIYRRITERRVYSDASNPSSLETRTTFSRPQIRSVTDYDDFVDVTSLDSTGNVLSKVRHFYHSNAGISFFLAHFPNEYTDWHESREYKTEFYNANNNLLKRVENVWEQTPTTGAENNPHISRTTTTFADVTPNLVTKQEFTYDQYNNQTDAYEYDFGAGAPGSLKRRTHTDYVTATAYTDAVTGAHLRRLPVQSSIFDAAGVERARSGFEYDNYTNGPPNHAPMVARASITGFDATFSTAFSTRGNVTATTAYLLTNGSVSGSITAYSQYDIAGNVVKSVDARGFSADFDFSDRFGAPDGEARANTQPSELGSASSYAFPTRVTNALGHQAYTQFDYYLGQPVDSEDANGTVTSAYFNDLLDRPTLVKRAVGTALVNQTAFAYDDVGRIITTTSDLDANNVLVSKNLYDGLGRTIESRTYEGGTNYIAVKQIPFTVQQDPDTGAWVHAVQSSNPYRPYLGEQPVWTTTFSDALGRIVKQRTPDNAIVRTSYSGNTVTVTDQAGKSRKSVADALGRLIEVYEDPAALNYQTTYAYDVLDNLTTVTQGTQTRSFAYDSLKRLSSATNPESGTITYQYDNNSNLIQKTDARGVVSLYSYDALNRNSMIDYSDTSSINPDVSRFYDGATNGKGRLWYSYSGGSDSAGSNVEKTVIDSYDTLGRPLVLKQVFKLNGVWSAPYQISRAYNLAGNVTSQTYPSGHSVTFNYDSAGRLADKDAQNLAFTGNLGDGLLRTYSRGISYASAGQLKQEQYGTTTPVYNKLFYNSRHQLAEILASTTGGDSSWNRGKIINNYSLQCSGAGCNATDNNGNLRKQEVYIPANDQVSSYTSWYQQYDYDALNRVLRAHEYTGNPSLDWQQEYVYDRWGNRTIHQTNTFGTGINRKDFTVNAANNRLGVPVGQSGMMSYDAAGNLTTDTYTGFGNRVYDAENKMTAAQDNSGAWSNYTYNADGQRTRRKTNNQETWQIYGFDGELLAEYPANGPASQPNKEYGYRNGQLLISAEAGVASAPAAFADDFNDNSLNANSWSVYYPGSSPTVSEQSQQLQISLSPNTAAYNGVYSNSTFDLTNRMVQLESVQAVSQAGWCENYLEVELNANNYFMIQVGAGNMIFRARVNGVNDQTSIPFDGVANRYWRIRHDQSANLIYFETSANDSVWLTRKTATPGFSLTSLRFHLLAGAWGTGNGSPGAAKFDNFKLLASSAGSVSLTVPNASFESPVLGNGSFQYGPSGGSWSFANGGGISGMNSPFTGVPSSAPDGVQVAFIQATGTISQSITGFQSSANYVITFSAIQRTNCCNTTGQDIGVYIDSTLVGTFHPGNSAYSEYSTASFTTTTGSHTIKFAGLNGAPTGETAFIDKVRITGTPKPGYGIQWLLTDQLGTPRMVFDESGALANVKRHDYLPFGEELFTPQGLRTSTLGYSANDGIRQQFTQKERDIETGLDYLLARYYFSIQGRFTSPDEFSGGPEELYDFAESAAANPSLYAEIANPQSLNKYQYAFNSPIRFVDPDGHTPCCLTDDQIRAANNGSLNIVTGIGKSVANIGIGMNNLMADFKIGGAKHVESFSPSNKTQEVAMVVTDDVTFFAGLLGGKAQVGGVAAAEAETTAVTASRMATANEAAVSTANGAQQLASAVRPKAAGGAQAVTGEVTTATSVRGGTPPSLNPTVQKLLDSIPQGARGRAHGRCCEPQLISNMLNAGVDPKGAAISVVRVRPAGNPTHATPIAPCSTCQLLLSAINK